MRDLTEPDTDIEIHVKMTRDEANSLITDMNHYGLSDVTSDFVMLIKGKLA